MHVAVDFRRLLLSTSVSRCLLMSATRLSLHPNPHPKSLNGLPTIRAFDGAAERFVHANMEKVDNANAAELYLNTAQRWMAFRLNVLSAVVSGMCGLLIYLFSDDMSAATSGLVLNYAADFCSYVTLPTNATNSTLPPSIAIDYHIYVTLPTHATLSPSTSIDYYRLP